MSWTPFVLTTQATGPPPSSPFPSPPVKLKRSVGPRSEYLANLRTSSTRQSAVPPKSRLLVLDIDNTLMSPVGNDGMQVSARPFLREFLEWVLDPETPYALALWTFSARAWAIAHLRAAGVGDLLFRDSSPVSPLLARDVVAFLGYEDSGLTSSQRAAGVKPTTKDLEILCSVIDPHLVSGQVPFDARNTVLVDDQTSYASCQPASIILADSYSVWANSPVVNDDDFLYVLVGALSDLAPETNFPRAIQDRGWNVDGLPQDDEPFIKIATAQFKQRGIGVAEPPAGQPVDQVDLGGVHPSLLASGPAHDGRSTTDDSDLTTPLMSLDIESKSLDSPSDATPATTSLSDEECERFGSSSSYAVVGYL